MENQSRMDSFMEAITNTAVGFIVSLVTWVIVAWSMNIPVTWGENFIIVSIFTVVSIIRSYILRRLFNGRSIWQTIRNH